MQLDRLLVILGVFGGGFLLLRPLVQAFAERLRHRDAPAMPGLGEEVLEELHAMRQEMSELAERVDFAERLLARQREAARIGPVEER